MLRAYISVRALRVCNYLFRLWQSHSIWLLNHFTGVFFTRCLRLSNALLYPSIDRLRARTWDIVWKSLACHIMALLVNKLGLHVWRRGCRLCGSWMIAALLCSGFIDATTWQKIWRCFFSEHVLQLSISF